MILDNMKIENQNDNSDHKTDDEMALEVLNGLWGYGEERKAKLEESGYDYNAIQSRLNDAIERVVDKNTRHSNTSIDAIIDELSRIIDQLEDLKFTDQEISGYIRYNIDLTVKAPKQIKKHIRGKIDI